MDPPFPPHHQRDTPAEAAMTEIRPALYRAARGMSGWTQEELGQRTGITMRTVPAFENNENRP